MQVFLTPSYLAIVMEYMAGGDLADLVDRTNWSEFEWPAANAARPAAYPNSTCLSEGHARWFFQQMMIAIHFCHAQVLPGAPLC
jgi:serine/threonine protein kinase